MNNYLPAVTWIPDREAQRRNGDKSDRKTCLALLEEFEPHVALLRKLRFIREARPAANQLAAAGFATDPGMTHEGLDAWNGEVREQVIVTLSSQIYAALDRRFAPIQRRILIRAAEQLESDAELARTSEVKVAQKYDAPEPEESPLVRGLKDTAAWCRAESEKPAKCGWCDNPRKALSHYFPISDPL